MKTSINPFAVAAMLSLALAGTAFAADQGKGQQTRSEHQSSCGAAHGAFADENGNFGWLGDAGGTPGYHGAKGQEAGATGYNNSHTDCQSAD